MSKPRKPVLAALLFVAAVLGAILYTSLGPGTSQYKVEICMSFQGRTECKTVRASTRDEAVRTAADNACTMIASGQSEFERCRNTPPVSQKWF